MIRVVNVRGLNRPEQRAGIVYCGRPFAGWNGHPLANPFPVDKQKLGQPVAARSEALEKYRDWLLARPTLEADLAALWNECRHGALPFGCWCTAATAGDGSEVVCHAQVLAELLRERFGARSSARLHASRSSAHSANSGGARRGAGGDESRRQFHAARVCERATSDNKFGSPIRPQLNGNR